MSKLYSREETIRMAQEKMRLQKEKEKREEEEYYKRATSGIRWYFFLFVVGFCTLITILSTIEITIDGTSEKVAESDWRIDRELYVMWHQSIKVDDYLFTPTLSDWGNRVENTLEITYSPIFGTGKKLSYDKQVGENQVVRQVEVRRRSIFTWFPWFQILTLLPLITLFFKSPKPMFNFARIGSMVLVFPATLLVVILTML